MTESIIDWETHFYSPGLFEYLQHRTNDPYYHYDSNRKCYRMEYCPGVVVSHGEHIINQLLDLEQQRLALMDQEGIDVQVLSLSEPGVEWMYTDGLAADELAKDANDLLYEAIQRHPSRYMGFAALAPQAADKAIVELERCVTKLGFIGWLTHANYGPDLFLDEARFFPVLEACEQLNVPIYIHPTIPAVEALHKYGFSLAGSPMGFQFGVALCFMRMVLAGIFDRLPKLKIILGHMGETLPFLMERLDFTYDKAWFSADDRPSLQRKPSDVLTQNVMMTTSGRYSEPLLRYIMDVMGHDRLMFASDYPYEGMGEGIQFIRNASISDAEKQAILRNNSATYLKSCRHY